MNCYLCGNGWPPSGPPAAYLLTLPNTNRIPVCVGCCAWWRMEAATDWPEAVPVSITQLGVIR